MILFYAWTNITLINMINTKVNCFGNIEADLLVRYSPTLSQDLIKEAKKVGVFRKIYIIDMPHFNKKRGVLGKIPKLRMFGMKKSIRMYYARFVEQVMGNSCYDKLLSGGLWNDTIFLMNALYKINPSICLEFVEEGERSYEGIKSIQQTILGGRWREKIIHGYNVGGLLKKYKKNITDTLYIYRPERYAEEERMDVRKIPQINKCDNEICYNILNKEVLQMEESHLLWYEKRTVYYLANYLCPGKEDTYGKAYQIIDSIISKVSVKQLAIKTHTSSTKHRLEFARQYEDVVFVDRNVFLFEGLYTKIDFNKKILVAKVSSALLYPMLIFGQEPYIIFTYRLFEYYHQFGDEIADRYINDMRGMYRNKERILVPNTLMEFEDMLQNAFRLLTMK